MLDSPTPLSDRISCLLARNTPENYEEFLRVFLASQLGVIVQGFSKESSGQFVAGRNELTAAMSATPDGRKVLLACADRAVFVQRYKAPFNAEVSAVSLLKMALANPNCEGIMINSAASEHSYVIPRDRVTEVIRRANQA